MRLDFQFFIGGVLVLATCKPSEPPPSDDAGSTSSPSGSSSSGADTRGDSTTASLDTATTTSDSTTDSSSSSTTTPLDGTSTGSSSGPGESSSSSSSSESTGPAPINGCADGEREALEDETAYPDIAACGGGFMVPGVLVDVPSCDRAGGDDGILPDGMGCAIEDLCSDGWHVCVDAMEVMTHGIDDCNANTFAGSFFATRQPSEGNGECGPTGTNDVFGCGDIGSNTVNFCTPLNRTSDDLCAGLPLPWMCGASDTQEAELMTKEGPELGGALCCSD